jgi:hypothetical protein
MRATTSCAFVMTRASAVGVVAVAGETLERKKVAAVAGAVLNETVTGRPAAGLVLLEHASVPHAAMMARLEKVLNRMNVLLVNDKWGTPAVRLEKARRTSASAEPRAGDVIVTPGACALL